MASEQRLIDAFRRQHGGDVIVPGDGAYEQGRRVWNALIDRRPALIARPRGASDVRAAILFAREHDLTIAVRGGGHSVAGRGTCDDGLVIDFADMKAIEVDPDARTARAEPGARWTEFDRATQAFDLAVTGGTIGDTGIAGLTLGGGFGWLGGILGMTVDNLLSADVVLASGEIVRASATEHPDLFWALRGGGGNFGVVTSFEYRLARVGPTIVGGMVVHPLGAAADALRFYRDLMAGAPDELTAAAAFVTMPDGARGSAIVVAHVGSVDAGERAVAPIKNFGQPLVDIIGPLPYVAQQALLENAMPPNLLNYWKADFIDEPNDELIRIAVEAYASVPSPQSSMLIFPIHGAASRVAPDATAYPHRRGMHFGIYSLWNDPARNAQNIAWVRDTFKAVQPAVAGSVYANELGEDEGEDRIRQAYSVNYDRLAAIKGRYDPDNVFRLNANIPPKGAPAMVPPAGAAGL